MSKRHRRNFIILTILLIIIAAFGGFFVILNAFSIGKIYPGIKIANIKISGLKPNEAQRLMKERTDVQNLSNDKLTFTIQNKTFYAKTSEVGIKIDIQKTIEEAFQRGRENNFALNLIKQSKAVAGMYNLPIRFDFDEEIFDEWAAKTFKDIENPAKNATLVFNEETNEFLAREAKRGTIVDRNHLKKELFSRVKNLSASPIALYLVEDTPEVEANETDGAKNEASSILANAPYKIKQGDKKWEIQKEQVAQWLEFEPKQAGENKILGVNLNKNLIKEYLISLSPSINRESVDAELEIKDGKATAFSLSQDGIELLMEENVELIKEKILLFESSEIELTVRIIPPKITTESIDKLGLTSLIGKGESNFAGSPKNRIHNIKTGAAKISGTLVKPGEEFSFNKTVGNIGPREGYLPALVIKSGATVYEYGGGMCQVSTTAFRAAINSGLKITERYPHAYPVKYYNPQGFDATVYAPHPDLRFINNTPAYMLIQARVEGNKLIFEIYGTNDGREVKIDGPYEYDKKSDGSLKATLTQEVLRDDEIIEKKTFYSSYKSPSLYPVERNPLE